jgi:hypothetical protein
VQLTLFSLTLSQFGIIDITFWSNRAKKDWTFAGSSTLRKSKKSMVWKSLIKVRATGRDTTIKEIVNTFATTVAFPPTLERAFVVPEL